MNPNAGGGGEGPGGGGGEGFSRVSAITSLRARLSLYTNAEPVTKFLMTVRGSDSPTMVVTVDVGLYSSRNPIRPKRDEYRLHATM